MFFFLSILVSIATSTPSHSFDSTGKPAPVTLIRAPQPGTWS
ncbi:unnamed protein product, partial [Rotaria magnacalcarata]